MGKASLLKIRKARRKDHLTIYLLILSATKRGKILKRTLSDIRNSIHHFWVAKENGKVIACCALEIYNKKLAEIRSLVVETDQEKKGIASQLLNQCIQEAKKKKIYEVLVITDRENIFKRFGFSEQLQGQRALFLRP